MTGLLDQSNPVSRLPMRLLSRVSEAANSSARYMPPTNAPKTLLRRARPKKKQSNQIVVSTLVIACLDLQRIAWLVSVSRCK